jgi:hypothetical protein
MQKKQSKKRITTRKQITAKKRKATRLSPAKELEAASSIVDNALARSATVKPAAFSDSFTTADACFAVEVKDPWGEVTEDIEVKIDCGGMIHGDEYLIDILIEMLEKARDNLIARRGPPTHERLEAL